MALFSARALFLRLFPLFYLCAVSFPSLLLLAALVLSSLLSLFPQLSHAMLYCLDSIANPQPQRIQVAEPSSPTTTATMIKGMWEFLWPQGRPDLKGRVVAALSLLVAAKVQFNTNAVVLARFMLLYS